MSPAIPRHRLAPDVSDIALLSCHLCQHLRCLALRQASALPNYACQAGLHVLGHIHAVATNEDKGLAVDQQVKKLRTVLLQCSTMNPFLANEYAYNPTPFQGLNLVSHQR